jgi:hypothetical protein
LEGRGAGGGGQNVKLVKTAKSNFIKIIVKITYENTNGLKITNLTYLPLSPFFHPLTLLGPLYRPWVFYTIGRKQQR